MFHQPNAQLAFAALLVLATTAVAQAGPLRDRLLERNGHPTDDASASAEFQGFGADAQSCADWGRKVHRLERAFATRHPGPTPDLKDIAYGRGDLRTLDVYGVKQYGDGPAPVIVMVHGGGWCVGDKAGPGITENKVSRWVNKGFVFVSVNYPMINEGSDALAQANDVAKAVSFVQNNAASWGADPGRVILMGHSAGAHLVSLVNADAEIRKANGVRSLLGTISLDAGAIDVVRQMPNVYPFLRTRYREAFGDTEQQWIVASPFHRLDRSAGPWLGVCSTVRKDDPCGQARAYEAKSESLGIRAGVLPEALSHGAINKELGLPGAYTSAVEVFMASLDARVASLLN